VTLITFFQGLATLLTSTLGIAAITVAIAGCAIAAAFHIMRWSHVFEAMAAGAVAFSAAWIVQTYIAGWDVDSFDKEILFVALTRPPLKFGVPFEAFVANFVLSFFIGLWLGNPFYWLICIAIHFPMRVIASYDPNFFRLARLWLMTKGSSVGADRWGGSMLAPIPDRPARSAKDRASCV
jgi:type IV secretory pathway VirB3-like protein